MKIIQAYKKKNENWQYLTNEEELKNPLVLVFANRMQLELPEVIDAIRKEFPYEHLVFGSTAGEILDANVFDDSIVVTAIEFEKSTFAIKTDNIFNHNKDANALGQSLYEQIPKENLKHLFVLSEGSFVNGSSLIDGLENSIQNKVPISGGMCGDDAKFEKTLASYKENPKEGEVVLIGFYGETLEISFSSFGGWSSFGPERIITRSEANVLYEIDGQPALDLYKKYLGDKANQLPQASLLYPLNVTPEGKSQAVVRTILNINNQDQSMILAGDAPENAKVQLMMASVDAIAEGASQAAMLAMQNRINHPQLALLVSCVGRKLVMNQRVEEEIERVQEIIGNEVAITGFYSYGEMAPFSENTFCELHNQTMTLTLISE
ncbi:FIST C-terminal domain-containing protein [Flavobacterium sp. Fl-77]|uniref:FIST C-terminal domain-containing protein n=1 Tax=Flavobacterium flavipigmentatum TaxID=2893884 RepID=A0AAJ2S8U8_9FLAO|nr:MULTISPECIES: FIST N-terminal domain-containing protein [unclassified Flavobacterium]MDX6183454.1 FIST C-terminal domain-containing protein [Flavobacterium sp. Fl-33]MDX6186738.1 FIST C-terminal domain-containing protein [Flavobacterium sp. Fl-77]UFH38495.1 FIST C-terminal domain-containing protein [Flavobacterium sp. F-70]